MNIIAVEHIFVLFSYIILIVFAVGIIPEVEQITCRTDSSGHHPVDR